MGTAIRCDAEFFGRISMTGVSAVLFLFDQPSQCSSWQRRLGVIHIIPPIRACPVRPKRGYSANARVYEYTAYGAAVNQDAPPTPGVKGQHARGVVSFPLRTSRGRGV